MNVTATVTAMLKSWPSLYSSRSDALRNMFSSSNYHWKDGELVPSCEGTLYVDRPLEDVLDDETKAQNAFDTAYDKLDREMAASDLLHVREENAKARFVWENAELIANVRGRFRANPSLTYTENFNLPADVKDEWRDAAKELAFSILAHEFITHSQYIPSYDEREMAEFERAKKFAQEFIDSFDPMKVAAREERVQKLLAEAEALGFKVVKK